MKDEDIKKALEDVLKDKGNGYPAKGKTLLGPAAFNTLFSRFTTSAEKLDLDAPADADRKNLARVAYRDYPARFDAVNDKIGEFKVEDLAPRDKQATPQYTNLKEQFKAKDCKEVRSDVVKVLGIGNKTHDQHGANFSTPQTLRQIIDDVLVPIKGDKERTRIEKVLKHWYKGYAVVWAS
jgi:hypothetical protein